MSDQTPTGRHVPGCQLSEGGPHAGPCCTCGPGSATCPPTCPSGRPAGAGTVALAAAEATPPVCNAPTPWGVGRSYCAEAPGHDGPHNDYDGRRWGKTTPEGVPRHHGPHDVPNDELTQIPLLPELISRPYLVQLDDHGAWVNPEHVAGIETAGYDDNCTLVYLAGGGRIAVVATTEQVAKRLNA